MICQNVSTESLQRVHGAYGKVLKLMKLPVGIPDGLFQKFNAKHEYQGTHNADWDKANHSWPSHPDGSSRESKHHTSSSAISTIVDEQDAVRVDQVILEKD